MIIASQMESEMYETFIDGKRVVVEKLGELVFRTGATIKHKAIRYRSLHDGEESARPVENFHLMFKKCGVSS